MLSIFMTDSLLPVNNSEANIGFLQNGQKTVAKLLISTMDSVLNVISNWSLPGKLQLVFVHWKDVFILCPLKITKGIEISCSKLVYQKTPIPIS